MLPTIAMAAPPSEQDLRTKMEPYATCLAVDAALIRINHITAASLIALAGSTKIASMDLEALAKGYLSLAKIDGQHLDAKFGEMQDKVLTPAKAAGVSEETLGAITTDVLRTVESKLGLGLLKVTIDPERTVELYSTLMRVSQSCAASSDRGATAIQ